MLKLEASRDQRTEITGLFIINSTTLHASKMGNAVPVALMPSS